MCVNGPQKKQKEAVRLCKQLLSRIQHQRTSREGAFLPLPVEKFVYLKNCWLSAYHPSLEFTMGLSNSIKGAAHVSVPSVRKVEPPHDKKVSKLLTEGIQMNKILPIMLTNVENRPKTVCEENKLIESAQKKLQDNRLQDKYQPKSTQNKVQVESTEKEMQPENVQSTVQQESAQKKMQLVSMQSKAQQDSVLRKIKLDSVLRDILAKLVLLKELQSENEKSKQQLESMQNKSQPESMLKNCQPESMPRECEPEILQQKRQDFHSERLQTKEQPESMLGEFQTESEWRKFQFKNLKANDEAENLPREFQPETSHKKKQSERVQQDVHSEKLQTKEQPENVLREFQTESEQRKFQSNLKANDQSESTQREFQPETLQKRRQSEHVQQDFQSENLQQNFESESWQTKQQPASVQRDMPLENLQANYHSESTQKEFLPESVQYNFKSESLQINDKSRSVQRESQSEYSQKEIPTDHIQQDFQSERVQREFQPQNIHINETITPQNTDYSQSLYFFPTSCYPEYTSRHSGATNLQPSDTVESNSSNSKLVPTFQSMQEIYYFWPYCNVNKKECPQFDYIREGNTTSDSCNDFSSKEKHFSELLASLQCTTRLIIQAQRNVYSKGVIEDMNSNKPKCLYFLINDIICLKDEREKLRAALPESIECLDLLQALHSDKHDLSQFELFNFLKDNFTPSAKYCNSLLAGHLFESCEVCHQKNKLNSDYKGNSLETEPSGSQNSQIINNNHTEANEHCYNDWKILAKDRKSKVRTYNAVKNRTGEKTNYSNERNIASNEQPNLLCSTETSNTSRTDSNKHHDESGYNYENDREQESMDKSDANISQWDPLREKINQENNLLYRRRPSNSTKKLSTEIDLSKYDKITLKLTTNKPNSSEKKQDLETLNSENTDSVYQQVPRRNKKVSNHKDRKDFPASTRWGEPLRTDFGKSFDTGPTEKYVSRKKGENDVKVRDERITKNDQVDDKLVTKIQFTHQVAASMTTNKSRAQYEIKLKDATNSKDKDIKKAIEFQSSQYKDPLDFKSQIRAEQIKIKELNNLIKRLEMNDKTVDSKYLLKGTMLCEKNAETAGEVRIVVRQERIGEFCHIIHTMGASHISYEQSIVLFEKYFTAFDLAKEAMKKVIHNCSVCFKK